jgi:hypothetical protein
MMQFTQYSRAKQRVSTYDSACNLQLISLCVCVCVRVCARARVYTGRFLMFSVITNIYNMKTKGPTLTL